MIQTDENNYVYNIEDYQGYAELKAMTAICHQELKNVDWDILASKLQANEKQTTSIGPSWEYATGNDKILFDSTDSASGGIVALPTPELGSWLYLLILPVNNDQVNYHINSLVKEIFQKTIEAVRTLPGVFHAHLNRFTPNFRVPPHIDDRDGSRISVVLTLQISKTSAELVTVGFKDKTYDFKDKEYFVFKSQVEHYADNKSDSDWVIMSIQIEKSYFK